MGVDVALFRLINTHSANRLGDAVLPWLTDGDVVEAVLGLLGVAILLHACLRGGPGDVARAWRVVVVAVAAVVLGEWLGSQWLRELVARPRPPRTLEEVRLLVGLGPSFSFPSAHATNTAAVAATVARAHPRWGRMLLAYAALVAYSRVYCGVHYPLDVLAGALLGLTLAALLWRATARWPARGRAEKDEQGV